MGMFLFAGDMIVMLFMIVLVVWVSMAASRRTLDYSAAIPLRDEALAQEGGMPEQADPAPESGEEQAHG